MNTELIEKIDTDFDNFCHEQLCGKCRYNDLSTMHHCAIAFAFDWLARHGYLKELPEKAILSKTESVADNSSAPATLPKWCKVGQWVMDEEMEMWKIVSFNKGLINAISTDREIGCVCHWRDIKPTRFRPYTYEEAKKLHGKVMEVPEKDGFCGIDLICSVSYDSESGEVFINGEGFKSLSEDGCLIDGRPIGVPEVDEDAMKGGEE